MASELDELIEFLSAPRVEVRQLAVEIVAGLTGDDDGIKRLAGKSADVIPALGKLLTDDQNISKLAAEALVNLSQEPRVFAALLAGGAVNQAMALISEPKYGNKKLLVMLLANITQEEAGASKVLQVSHTGTLSTVTSPLRSPLTSPLTSLVMSDRMIWIGKCVSESLLRGRGRLQEGGEGGEMGTYVSRLVRLFTRSGEEEETDTFDHVANILVNVSRLEPARKLLLDANRGLFRQLLPQIESNSLIRRRGVAGCVRNCCFESATSLPTLLAASQYLWPALLLPLAGPKAYSQAELDKMPAELAAPLGFEREKESDPKVKVEAAEAIYLIALQEGGRKALWAVNAPKILEIGYEDEEEAEVMEAFEKIGALVVASSVQLVSGSMEEEGVADPEDDEKLKESDVMA